MQAGQAEHLTPAVRGGSNQYANLALAHVSCNREKANKTLGEYIEWRRVVGLPRCTYSSDKLKNAIASGEKAAKSKPSPRSSRRKKEPPVKVSWMPGRGPDREARNMPDLPSSAMPTKQDVHGEKSRRNSVYRFVGNLPSDDIRPNQRDSHSAIQELDDIEQRNEVTKRDTTYRFRRQDLADPSFTIG